MQPIPIYCYSWNWRHIPGNHNETNERVKLYKTQDRENGELRNTVQKITRDTPPKRSRKNKKLNFPFQNQIQKVQKPIRYNPNQYLQTTRPPAPVPVPRYLPAQPPVPKPKQKVSYVTEYPARSLPPPNRVKKPPLRDEDLDEYESDFIDDSNLNEISGSTGYNMRPSSTQRMVSGVIKDLFGRNKYDYLNEDDGDIEVAGFQQIQAEERRTQIYGRREDAIEWDRLQMGRHR